MEKKFKEKKYFQEPFGNKNNKLLKLLIQNY